LGIDTTDYAHGWLIRGFLGGATNGHICKHFESLLSAPSFLAIIITTTLPTSMLLGFGPIMPLVKAVAYLTCSAVDVSASTTDSLILGLVGLGFRPIRASTQRKRFVTKLYERAAVLHNNIGSIIYQPLYAVHDSRKGATDEMQSLVRFVVHYQHR